MIPNSKRFILAKAFESPTWFEKRPILSFGSNVSANEWMLVIRKIKLHVYSKRQPASDSTWEFLKIENEQIKAA